MKGMSRIQAGRHQGAMLERVAQLAEGGGDVVGQVVGDGGQRDDDE